MVVGPFEEEEEGTGLPSDVVKVHVPGTITIPKYWFNKNKATHTQYSVK